MKIKVFLFVLLISALLLASCGGGATQEAAKPEEKPAAEQPQEAAKPEEKPTAAQPQEAAAEQVELIINSWRNDDLLIWQDTIIPAFNKHYPNIKVTFSPDPPAEYNAALNSRLEGSTAGDLITCRPFDASLKLFEKGYLAPLNDLPVWKTSAMLPNQLGLPMMARQYSVYLWLQ